MTFALIGSVWVVPVRGGGPRAHLIHRDKGAGVRGSSLCGQEGPLDRYGYPKFSRVHGRAAEVCNACHAVACRENARIDWS